ncbi:unnamed protein product [Mytilus edulis]|uniref:YqaJ viral recombinase domain-containing protein n=1 Tax=Mytilus edulis TaxID=6550 RepID=A0A8S3T8Q7_MYTED|nr:unnamed protein product [Mytilus edulis]
MGSDIVAHRISIGLFYCKLSSGCVKTVIKHTVSFNDVLFEICVNLEKCKLWILSKYKSYSDIVSFYMLLYSLLLICGDIESNPGPGGTPDPPEKTLSIFHGNIRSLRNKLNYITDIIEDFDIVFFTESHLDVNVTDFDISLFGFETPVRKDRNANGGGIIMYYKSLINIVRRVDLEHDEVEMTDSIPVVDKDTVPIDRKISDHDGTYVTINCGFTSSRTYKRKIWDYKNGDFDLMNQKVSRTNWEHLISDADNMNVACTNFTNSLLDIASECIPTREVVVRCDDKIWYNSNLRREMRKRDRFRKLFLRLKTSFAELKFKQQRNKVNNMKKQAKKHFYASLNENLDEIKQANPKQYWKIINMHIKSDRPVRDVPPLKDPNQNYNLAYESSEKSEILNKYFCSIANLENPDKDLPAFNDRCADFLSSIVVSEQDGENFLEDFNVNAPGVRDTPMYCSSQELRTAVEQSPLLPLFKLKGTTINKSFVSKPAAKENIPKDHGEHDSLSSCQRCSSFYSKYLAVDLARTIKLQTDTINQSKSFLWKDARKIRITASSASKVPIKETTDCTNFIREHLHPKFVGNKFTKHGQEGETAAKEYLLTNGYRVVEKGTYVSSEENWLSASPDGILNDDTLLEIKSPVPSAKWTTLNELFTGQTYDAHMSDNGILVLQIQLTMFCTRVRKCKLLIWLNPDEFQFIEVPYDEQYVCEHVARKRKFYFKKMMNIIVDEIEDDRLVFSKVLDKMNTRGQKKKRKSTTKTSTLEATTRQEDTPPPIVQDTVTVSNIPSTSGAVMNPVVTNRQELVKYMSSVRKGAKRHGGIGWKYYDEQYRLKKAREPSGSWGKLDSEYWMWYMQSASVQPEGQAANQASNSRALYTNQTATTSRCYSFNFDGVCNKPNCIYNHSCLRCGLHHPIISCYKQNQFHGQVSNQTRTEPRFNGPRFTRPRSNFRSPRPNYQRPNGRFMGARQNTY